VDPEWLFRSGPGSYFSAGFGSNKNILNINMINFTFVFPFCNCFRLIIMTRYKLFREIFYWQTGILIFLFQHFCWEIVKFYQFFGKVLLQIHFGSEAK
jgi:hypothetical protein